MRIAYVEDNPTNLALVERVARMTKHIVVSYTEGEIALEALKHEHFDLILMDVELAGELSGLQVVRKLRESGLSTPIIAVTAYAMMGDRERCIEAGCNDYLPKPLPINDFILMLAKYDALLNQPVPADDYLAAPAANQALPVGETGLDAPTQRTKTRPLTRKATGELKSSDIGMPEAAKPATTDAPASDVQVAETVPTVIIAADVKPVEPVIAASSVVLKPVEPAKITDAPIAAPAPLPTETKPSDSHSTDVPSAQTPISPPVVANTVIEVTPSVQAAIEASNKPSLEPSRESDKLLIDPTPMVQHPVSHPSADPTGAPSGSKSDVAH